MAARDRPHGVGSRPAAARLAGLLRTEASRIAASALLAAFDVGATLAIPFLARRAMDGVLLGPAVGRGSLAAALCGAMCLLAAFRAAAAVVGGSLAAKAGARIVAKLREALHGALLELDWAAFSARAPGEYSQRILFDTETIQRFLVDTGSKALVQVLTAAGTCAALFALDAWLAVVALLPVPALVALGARFRRRLGPSIAVFSTEIASIQTALSETAAGLATVRLSGCEAWRAERFAGPVRRTAERRAAMERTLLGFSGASGAVSAFAVAAVWLAAGLRAAAGHGPTPGTILAFLGFQALFYGPVGWFAQLFGEFVESSVAAARVFEILDAPRERRGGAAAPDGIRTGIELEDVRFAYPGGAEVLRGVRLRLLPGETVALIGRSGAGKTTLANLLAAFLEPSSGRILADGTPLDAIDPVSWRRRIAFVPQDPFLFRASFHDNIALGSPDATDAAIEAAARAAGAHGFIVAREGGYDVPLGEGGAGLSGGERQRIALARALLRNPILLVLDEPTAALDERTEESLRETFRRIGRDRIVLVVTHRPSLADDADRVVELSDGLLREQRPRARRP